MTFDMTLDMKHDLWHNSCTATYYKIIVECGHLYNWVISHTFHLISPNALSKEYVKSLLFTVMEKQVQTRLRRSWSNLQWTGYSTHQDADTWLHWAMSQSTCMGTPIWSRCWVMQYMCSEFQQFHRQTSSDANLWQMLPTNECVT